MSQTSRKSREKKSGKWLVRQQPERKEKHRSGQRRANHEQRHELSKLRATYEDATPTQTNQPNGGRRPLKFSHFPSHGAISLEAKS